MNNIVSDLHEKLNNLDNTTKIILVIIVMSSFVLITNTIYTNNNFITVTGKVTNIQNCANNKCYVTASYVVDKKNYTKILLKNDNYTIGDPIQITYNKLSPDDVVLQ
jgi:hypothetical protein